ncbi:hypothetical protein [Chitinophaga caseinilytica]|uniref:Uncharacterized protein n=1 Tax=Chitinophaga caseinilytica TaxID=2267521 RepID=A0ABZ2ZAU3_9BACT
MNPAKINKWLTWLAILSMTFFIVTLLHIYKTITLPFDLLGPFMVWFVCNLLFCITGAVLTYSLKERQLPYKITAWLTAYFFLPVLLCLLLFLIVSSLH